MLPDLDILQEALADALGEHPRQLVGHLFAHTLGLFDDDAPLQDERVLGHRVVAVDQDRLGLVVAVAVVQPVDHERRPEVRRLRIQMRLTVRRPQIVDIGPAHVVQILRGDVALEDVLEVRRQTEVDVEEVRHIGDVVDDVAAVGPFDEDAVPPPVGPLVAGRLGNLGDPDRGVGWIALMVVPDKQQPAAHIGRPRPSARHSGCAPGIRHQFAAAVATPAPVVERASDLVAFDGALGQVAAHVPAVAVEDFQVPVGISEHNQLGAERLYPVWLPFQIVLRDAQAMPATRIPGRQGAGIDLPNTDPTRVGTHLSPPDRYR